jgi:hypothetical protein
VHHASAVMRATISCDCSSVIDSTPSPMKRVLVDSRTVDDPPSIESQTLRAFEIVSSGSPARPGAIASSASIRACRRAPGTVGIGLTNSSSATGSSTMVLTDPWSSLEHGAPREHKEASAKWRCGTADSLHGNKVLLRVRGVGAYLRGQSFNDSALRRLGSSPAVGVRLARSSQVKRSPLFSNTNNSGSACGPAMDGSSSRSRIRTTSP